MGQLRGWLHPALHCIVIETWMVLRRPTNYSHIVCTVLNTVLYNKQERAAALLCDLPIGCACICIVRRTMQHVYVRQAQAS